MPFDEFLRTNNRKIDDLARKFSSFPFVDKQRIENWLNNFNDEHLPIALKFLENTNYFDNTKIIYSCQSLYQQIAQIRHNNFDNLLFSALGSAGKSGQRYLTEFRSANGLSHTRYNPKFKYSSELGKLEVTSSIIFIDDFIGTGSQTRDFLDILGMYLDLERDITLAVFTGFRSSIDELQREYGIKIIADNYLEEEDRIFSVDNLIFSEDERNVLKQYCDSTGCEEPYGFKNCQASIIFPTRVPNDSIPILYFESRSWKNLFKRHY